jgi:1,4-dihydroxy-2-naphthoate octaprenyltransferase
MATAAQWLEGARPRTLPAAVAPVAAGTGAAAHVDGAVWWAALLCLLVALALQVGVNYANDYSDGVRGTDADRVGPLRLVGSGAAEPAAVKRAALAALGVAVVAGAALVVATGAWPLLLVGAASVVAAWYYTGGRRPYGYSGFGEVSVFVFFGLVATVGTAYAQTLDLHAAEVLAGTGCGALACAVLVANNLRDVPGDSAVGKRTLAVLLGDARTRLLYVGLVAVAAVVVLAAGLLSPWSLLGLLALAVAVGPVRAVRAGAAGRDLVPVLGATGRLLLAYGLLLGLGLALG